MCSSARKATRQDPACAGDGPRTTSVDSARDVGGRFEMCTWTSMSAAVLAMSAGAALANDVTFTGNDDGTTWNQSANWDNDV